MSQLHFVRSELASTLEDPSGVVIDARYYVHATEGDAPQPSIFDLTVMAPRAYEAWYIEREVEGGQANEEDIFPLIIPDLIVATTGILAHMEQTFFNTVDPTRIDELRPFLFPLPEDTPAAA